MGLVSAGCSSDIVRSGHIEFDTLWASNDVQVRKTFRQSYHCLSHDFIFFNFHQYFLNIILFFQTNQPTINVLNAPNSSTLQCGCENITCPFCNLMLSIEQTDPTVLKWNHFSKLIETLLKFSRFDIDILGKKKFQETPRKMILL